MILWCNPEDITAIQLKLDEITGVFSNVKEMARLHLDELNKGKVKAEHYEKLSSDLDEWLTGKEAIIEQWEEYSIDSVTLEQQIKHIKVFPNHFVQLW